MNECTTFAVYYYTNTLIHVTMLTVNHLSFSYSRRKPPVLADFSLSVPKGGVYGLLGPNGAGKSTLLYLIAGALTPDSGEVLFLNENTRRRLPSILADIFVVPEEFELPAIPLSEFVERNAHFYPRFSMDELKSYINQFDLDMSINLGALSMGQKKKAFISFALAANTSLLLMDEPSNGLDIPGKAAFRRVVASAVSDERIVVISTHQVKDVERLLDHVIIMNDRKVLLNKSIDEISSHLSFITTSDKALIDKALYSQPGLEGTNIVLPASQAEETNVNLESLFVLALSNPQVLINQFECNDNDNSDK